MALAQSDDVAGSLIWWAFAPLNVPVIFIIIIFLSSLVFGGAVIYLEYNKKRLDFERTGKVVLCLLPIVGIAGLVVTYLMGEMNFFILSLYLALPMILATITYWSLFRNDEGLALPGPGSEQVAEKYVVKKMGLQETKLKLIERYSMRVDQDRKGEGYKKWLDEVSTLTNRLVDEIAAAIDANHDYRKTIARDNIIYERLDDEEKEFNALMKWAKSRYTKEMVNSIKSNVAEEQPMITEK